MRAITLKTTVLTTMLMMISAFATVGWADSGTFNMHYTKNNPIPVGDKEGHIIYLGESHGTAKGGWKDGGKVLNRDYVDIIKGNGTHQGYITVTRNGDK
ncbi:MAG: hypothetical protein M3120_02970, partial [Pseudomonadota bacterium]|nr:hypothetical protein [Pseudomonadota bacterium]